MATPEEQEKLYVDVLKADLESYRKLETWGSSLFLGALGLLAKQLVDWELNPEQGKRLALTTGIALLPATLGLTAFIFLRVVNFRSYRADRELRKLAGRAPNSLRVSWGALGLLLAIMPLLLGYAVSWSFALGRPERETWMGYLSLVGGFALVVGLAVHFMARKSRS